MKSLISKLGSRKLWMGIGPIIISLIRWASTGVPPSPTEWQVDVAALIVGIAALAHVDATIAKNGKE